MGFLDGFWARLGAKDGSSVTAEGGLSATAGVPTPEALGVPRRTSRDRIEGVALRSAESLGNVWADSERVKWVLLQPEVDGVARRFAALAGLGDGRAAEAREARETLGAMLLADLPRERPDHLEQLLDAIQRNARDHMRPHGFNPGRAVRETPMASPTPAPTPTAAAVAVPEVADPVATLLEPTAPAPRTVVAPAPVAAEVAADPEDGSATPVEYELRGVAGSSANDLDFGLVRQYVRASSARRPSSPLAEMGELDVLRTLKAIEGPRGRERASVLGGLFFATQPEQLVVQSKVRFVEFPGVEVASTGEKVAYRYTEEITGTIPELIARMERLHKERLAPGVLADGFRVEEVPAVPLFALREAMVNAVCHRDYSLVGANIQVRLFEDRLEVQSPGGLPGPITVDNILTESYARNPRVADMLRDLGYVERHGLGIDNMFASMRDAHLPPPEFGNSDTSFTVTLRFRAPDEADPESWLAEIGAAGLSHEPQRALLFARRVGHVSAGDYLSIGALDEAEATEHLRRLVRGRWLVQGGTRGAVTYALGPRAGSAAAPDAAAQDAQLPQAVLDSLPASQRRVLDIVIRQGKVKPSEVLEISGLKDRRTIQRALAALAERGLVVRRASSPTDPGATYQVNRDFAQGESE